MWVSGNLFVYVGWWILKWNVKCAEGRYIYCRHLIIIMWIVDFGSEWVVRKGSLAGSLLNPLLILEIISPPIMSHGTVEQDNQLLSKDCSTGSYNLLWTQVKNGWAGQLKRRLCTIPWPSESIKFNLWTSKVHTCDKFYYPKAQSAYNPMASAICILCGGVECE